MKNTIGLLIVVALLALTVNCKGRAAKNNSAGRSPAVEVTGNITEVGMDGTVYTELSAEAGLDSCISVFMQHEGLDSIAARMKCRCLLDAYVSIDSTVNKMLPDVRNAFMQKHKQRAEAICDSLMKGLN